MDGCANGGSADLLVTLMVGACGSSSLASFIFLLVLDGPLCGDARSSGLSVFMVAGFAIMGGPFVFASLTWFVYRIRVVCIGNVVYVLVIWGQFVGFSSVEGKLL